MQSNPPYLLVVDDDVEDWLFFEQEFCNQAPGTGLVYKETGEELMRYLNDCPPADLPRILLLDFKLPDISAPDILRMLNSIDRYKQMIKVVWSTSRRIIDMDNCKRLGAINYFIKPTTTEEINDLVLQVRALLESPR